MSEFDRSAGQKRVVDLISRLERRAEHLRNRLAKNVNDTGSNWDRKELSALDWAVIELREKHGLPEPEPPPPPSIPASER
jgi:hypothetical protein